jgi:hypothetical protein
VAHLSGTAYGLRMFGRRRKQDFFQRESAERRAAEDEQPWFMAPDDGPELDVDAGRSARMDEEPPSR